MATSGLVYIDNGTKLNSYECFIDTGYVETAQTLNAVQIYKNTPYYPNEGSSDFSYKWHQVSAGSGFSIGNDIYGNTHCIEITFTTPENLEAFDSISVELLLYEYINAYGVSIRYALCTSNINRNKYVGTSKEVSDDYQLVSDYCYCEDYENYEIALQVDNLTSNTTYYLYLWPTGVSSSSASGIQFSGVIITANYLNATTTSGFIKYVPYIDNGTSWEPL